MHETAQIKHFAGSAHNRDNRDAHPYIQLKLQAVQHNEGVDMVAIGAIRSWQPGHGPVTTWTASPASRAAAARAPHDPLPPTFQQMQHLLTADRARTLGRSAPRLIMAAWDVDGWCDIAAMTEAINAHLRRHDTYRSAFDVVAGTITRRTVDADCIEFVPEARGFMDEGQIRAHALNSTPGTLEWDCFTFGVVQKSDHFTVFANIDHLHTDGSSAVEVYRDIHRSYQALAAGGSATLPQTSSYRDYTRRQRLKVDALTLESRPIKDWVDFARDTDGEWPSFPLPLGEAPANAAGAAISVELLNAAETEAFNNACRAAGARFSGGVMACAALADHEFTGSETFHTFTPSDNRSGPEQSQCAGWFASIFPVSMPIEGASFAQIARAAQKSFDANKHLSAVPFRRVQELAPLEELGVRPASKPSMMVSLFDFRSLADARANRLGLYIDDLSHGDLNMWVTRNAHQTTVMVCYPDTAEARHSVHLYLQVLRRIFLDVANNTRAFAHSA
jgi:hypothetical protein